MLPWRGKRLADRVGLFIPAFSCAAVSTRWPLSQRRVRSRAQDESAVSMQGCNGSLPRRRSQARGVSTRIGAFVRCQSSGRSSSGWLIDAPAGPQADAHGPRRLRRGRLRSSRTCRLSGFCGSYIRLTDIALLHWLDIGSNQSRPIRIQIACAAGVMRSSKTCRLSGLCGSYIHLTSIALLHWLDIGSTQSRLIRIQIAAPHAWPVPCVRRGLAVCQGFVEAILA